MSIFSALFGKKKSETEGPGEGSVEEFIMLIRVYYQGVMASNLGITNLQMLPDLALFKRMLKIPTQNNKLGVAEKSRVRKILIQDYGLNDEFFREIDASVKKNCKTQQHVQSYFFQFQGFCNDLFTQLESLMGLKFRFSILVKKLLRAQTEKTVHEIMTKQEWKEVKDQKAAWAIRKYAETLGFSEQWITDLIYNIVLLARKASKQSGNKQEK